MEKKLLFKLSLYRGRKKGKTFVFNNFRQALVAMRDQGFLYIENYMDIAFYPEGIKKTSHRKPKRFYLAEMIDYPTARYKAVNLKWLSIPPDFLYDKKYEKQQFYYSKKADEIATLYLGDSLCLSEEGIERLINATSDTPPHPYDAVTLVDDIEFMVGTGKKYKPASEDKDLGMALLLMQRRPNYNRLRMIPLVYKYSGKLERGEPTELIFDGENLSLKNIELWKEQEKSLSK